MIRIYAALAMILAMSVSKAMAEPAQDWTDRIEITGWAEAIHSAAVDSPHEPVTSRARLRLNMEADLGPIFAKVSGDAEKNLEIESETGVRLHEAWMEYVGSSWDVRLGRQVIIWGKADGVQITDVICPPDYTESITRDLDEIRMPVDAAKLRFLGENLDTEFIWIPFFRSAELAGNDSPWEVKTVLPASVSMTKNSTDKPDAALENGEFALRLSSYQSGFDISASAFYTWDDFATSHRTVSTVGSTTFVTVSPEHHRMGVVGLDFSRPWSDFVFRFETACYLGRYFETKSLAVDPIKKNSVKWLAGVDWTPGDDWSIIAQYTGEDIIDYNPILSSNHHDRTVTLNISKDLLRDTLTLSSMLYYNCNDQDSFLRAKADYEYSDGLHFIAGLDLFNGKGAGSYGRYDDNSQLWFKTKYSF